MSGSVIEIVTLGRAAVLREGAALPLVPGTPAFVLLVRLAVDGPASRSRIRELLWPDLSVPDGDERLGEVLRAIEDSLGPGLIQIGDDRLRIDTDQVDCDVSRLRSAVEEGRPWEVITVDRGPFLDGLPLDQYDDGSPVPGEVRAWVRATRSRVAGLSERARSYSPWKPEAPDDFWNRLVREVRSRSVIYATVLYLGFSGGMIQVSNVLIENTGLPDSAFFVVLALLALGLPVMITVVWFLEELEARSAAGLTWSESPASRGKALLARIRVRNVHLVSFLGVLALASGAGWMVAHWGGSGALSQAWAELPPEKGIAVLPFGSNGDSPGDLMSGVLMETITGHLARVEGLQGSLWMVPSIDLQEMEARAASDAHRLFGVDLALRVRTEPAGDTVHVTMELEDAREDRLLRLLRFSAPMYDVAGIEAAVLGALGELLDLEVTGAERDAVVSGGTLDRLARGLYAQGRQYLERFEREQSIEYAIEVFGRALERDPDFVLARAGLAEAYLKMYDLRRDLSDLERGREVAEKALGQEKPVAAVHVTLGLIDVETGRHEQAIESFRRALDLEPHLAEAHLGIAEAFQSMRQIDEAESHYLMAVELRPGYWGGHNQLGGFYAQTGRLEEAAEAFGAVVDLAPDNHRGWANLGAVRISQGKPELGEEALQRSVALVPNSQAYANLAYLYHSQSRYQDALEINERAVELDDRDYEAWYNLAAVIHSAGVGTEARAKEACDRIVELGQARLDVNPRETTARTRMAFCYAFRGDSDHARLMLRRALDESPDDPQLLFLAGTIYESPIGDREQAVRLISEALERGHRAPGLWRSANLAGLREDPRIQRWLAEGSVSPDS